MDRDVLTTWVTQHCNTLLSTVLAPWHSKWDTYVKQYKAIRDSETKTFPWPKCSNMFVPEMANAVEGVVAWLLDGTLEQAQPVSVEAFYAEDREAADALERWLNYVVTVRMRLPRYYRKYMPYLALLGTHVAKLQSDASGAVQPEGIQLHRFLIYPGERCAKEACFVGDVRYVPIDWLYEQEQLGRANKEDIEKIVAGNNMFWSKQDPQSTYRAGKSDMEIPPGTLRMLDLYCSYSPDYSAPTVDLHIHYDMQSQTIVWVEEFARDRRPYFVHRFVTSEDHIFGIGLGDRLWTLQSGANTTLNQLVDAGTLANANVIRVDPAYAEEGTIEVYPGKVLEAPRGGIEMLQLGMVNPQSFGIHGTIREAIGRVSGGEEFLGLPSSTIRTRQTFGGQAMNAVQQSRRLSPKQGEFRDNLVDLLWWVLEAVAAAAPETDIMTAPEKAELGTFLDQLDKTPASALEDSFELRLEPEEASGVRKLLVQDVVRLRGRIEIKIATLKENRQVEQQASLMVAQLVQQYLERVVGLAMQLEQLKQQPGAEQMVQVLQDAWQVSNRLMKRVLMSFSVEDAREMIISVQKMEEGMNGAIGGLLGGMPEQALEGEGGVNQERSPGSGLMGAGAGIAGGLLGGANNATQAGELD